MLSQCRVYTDIKKWICFLNHGWTVRIFFAGGKKTPDPFWMFVETKHWFLEIFSAENWSESTKIVIKKLTPGAQACFAGTGSRGTET
jgi:hypothetical protein